MTTRGHDYFDLLFPGPRSRLGALHPFAWRVVSAIEKVAGIDIRYVTDDSCVWDFARQELPVEELIVGLSQKLGFPVPPQIKLWELAVLLRDFSERTLGRVAIDQCIKGRIYELRSRRAMPFGAWDGKDGFVGLSHELGCTAPDGRSLFTELHWDASPRLGTVRCAKDTGIDVPEGIEIVEHWPGDREMVYNEKLDVFLRQVERLGL